MILLMVGKEWVTESYFPSRLWCLNFTFSWTIKKNIFIYAALFHSNVHNLEVLWPEHNITIASIETNNLYAIMQVKNILKYAFSGDFFLSEQFYLGF